MRIVPHPPRIVPFHRCRGACRERTTEESAASRQYSPRVLRMTRQVRRARAARAVELVSIEEGTYR
ncbi:hypothetical protein DP49_6016 [Burkholderia pseudomallei]|nr:hypothetical protein DP49_6016 [Burkholderia pseudomallei]